jgi:hypothetical protein
MNLRIPSSSFSHRNDDLKELGRGSQGVAKLAKDAAGREFCVRPPSHGHRNDLKMARSAEFRTKHIWLVVWNMFFPISWVTTDELHDFSEGWLNHQPVLY